MNQKNIIPEFGNKSYTVIMRKDNNKKLLIDFVKNHRDEFIKKSIFGAKSANLFSKNTNPIFDWTVQDSEQPSTIGHNFDYHHIVDKKFCNISKDNDDVEFNKEYIDIIIKKVNAKVENMIYQGDSTKTRSNDNGFDGLIKILTTTGNTAISTTGTSSVTAYNFIKQVASKIPSNVQGKNDVVILVSVPFYNAFIQELNDAKLYDYKSDNGNLEYVLPGTNFKVIGVNDLNDTATYDYVIAGSLSNIFYELKDNENIRFDIWLSPDDHKFHLDIQFTADVRVESQDEIVLGKYTK